MMFICCKIEIRVNIWLKDVVVIVFWENWLKNDLIGVFNFFLIIFEVFGYGKGGILLCSLDSVCSFKLYFSY